VTSPVLNNQIMKEKFEMLLHRSHRIAFRLTSAWLVLFAALVIHAAPRPAAAQEAGAKGDRPSDSPSLKIKANSTSETKASDEAAAENALVQKTTPDRGREIDTAIDRLREKQAFVREFHPRGNAKYWVQIIVDGADDMALEDVESISRGVSLDLHLRNPSVTPAGLVQLASAGKIQQLELSGEKIDDSLLKTLPMLPIQGQLDLSSNLLTDAGIQSIADCHNVTGISLRGRELSDDCLKYLVKLPKLKRVTLGPSFTRDAFDYLVRLESLTSLDASALAPRLSDLTKLPKLTNINLSGKEYGDENAETIADTFKSLEELYLRHTSITNAGVQSLSRIGTLKILTLDDSNIDDAAGESLRKMKQLTWLSLENCAVKNNTLAAISELPDLSFLFLSGTPVTDAGIESLVKLKKPLTLQLMGCKLVTDASIKPLSKLPGAANMNLNIQRTGITEAGARQLQAKLPQTRIIWGVPEVPLK
jgi:Leucine-rich repeat (LRR) protein